jgi:hypothetical protein
MRLPRLGGTRSIVAIGLMLLAASSPVLAQGQPAADAGSGPPARIGNIYDHTDHQPTEAELRAAGGSAGVDSFSSTTRQQVEEEVKKLLETTDKLDKQSQQQNQDYLGGSGPKDGR